MMQGLYFLMHLAIICNPTGTDCTVLQTILDVYPNRQICLAVEDGMEKRLPKEMFYCVEFRNI